MDGTEALALLMEGNRRFLKGRTPPAPQGAEIARLAAEGQRPYAVVVACSDARVPPELVFCCGLGEIFTVRTAGNVVSDLELGSVEFGVRALGARLVLVLGHTGCGAVAGAMATAGDGHLAHVLAEVAHSVHRAQELAQDERTVAELAEELNIHRTAERIRADPALSCVGDLVFTCAKYDTCTGAVTVLNG